MSVGKSGGGGGTNLFSNKREEKREREGRKNINKMDKM